MVVQVFALLETDPHGSIIPSYSLGFTSTCAMGQKQELNLNDHLRHPPLFPQARASQASIWGGFHSAGAAKAYPGFVLQACAPSHPAPSFPAKVGFEGAGTLGTLIPGTAYWAKGNEEAQKSANALQHPPVSLRNSINPNHYRQETFYFWLLNEEYVANTPIDFVRLNRVTHRSFCFRLA